MKTNEFTVFNGSTDLLHKERRENLKTKVIYKKDVTRDKMGI